MAYLSLQYRYLVRGKNYYFLVNYFPILLLINLKNCSSVEKIILYVFFKNFKSSLKKQLMSKKTPGNNIEY